MLSGAERMSGLDAGVGAEHNARAGRDHPREIVGEYLLTRGRIQPRWRAVRRQWTLHQRGTDVGDHLRGQCLLKERIVIADSSTIAQPDHSRPVRLFLL